MQRESALLLIAASMLVASCTGGEAVGPPTTIVTGAVTRQGMPVSDAIVSFEPVDEQGQHAQAFTDDDGRFDVSIYVNNKTIKRGMAPGHYRVTVRQVESPSGKSTLSPPKNLLPEKYASPATSELEATIDLQNPTELTFEIDG